MVESNSHPLLSVVVCTYNRSLWLRNCLNSLERPCADAGLVEVVIVDNNSSDDTRMVAESFTSRLLNYRYVFEPSQGLAYARNRGYKEARGEYVGYVDDDARVQSDWVNEVVKFIADHPKVVGVGGPYRAYSTIPIPEWFPKEYGCYGLGDEIRVIRESESISGTNMIFRKIALEELGGFNPRLGMTGDKMSYGEETHLIRRMKMKGMDIFYCPAIVVEHAVLPHKFSLWWLLKSNFSNGKDWVSAFEYRSSAMAYFPVLMRGLFGAMAKFFSCNERYFKARIYRSTATLSWQIGVFTRLMGF